MNNKLTFIKRTLYKLRQNYGKEMDLYRVDSNTLNLQVGTKTVTKTRIHIKRGILLPYNEKRDYLYNITFLAANKNFAYGANFDKKSRDIILDFKYLDGYTPTIGDYFVIDRSRYNIKTANKFEFGFFIIVESIEAAQPNQVVTKNIEHQLIPIDSLGGEI